MASDHVSSDPGPQRSTMVLEQDSLSPGPQSQENVPQVAEIVTTSNELELIYSPMFSELLNGTSHVVSKSSVVHAADNPDKRQQHNTTHTSTTTDVADQPPLNIRSTHQTPTQVPTVTAPENIGPQRSTTLDLLYSLMFSELLNGTSHVVSKSSAVHAVDNPDKRQQYNTTHTSTTTDVADPPPLNIRSTHQTPTQVPTVTAPENIIQAETNTENAQFDDDEFINIFGEDILLVQIYVDDIIFGSTNPKLSKRFRKLMHSKFDMFMMGELKFFLRIQIHQSPRGIFINQAKYAQEIHKKYGMTSCDSIGTPMATKHLDADLSGTPVDQTKYHSMVRALMYLTTNRPDIVHATRYCAHYQAKPTEKHLTAVKRIFWYLKYSINMGLWYPKHTSFELTAFSDLDHAGCLDSPKAEYVSLSACCAQVLWLRTQLMDYGFHFDKIPMYCDAKAAIAISRNPVQHSRTKHINVRYNFIKEQVEKGIVELLFVETEYQLADLFTKALSEDRFKYLVRRLGMRCLTPDELEILAIESA
ncbi:retrovirus-related pol polyprotein from transposon TNT 1-94 [Tanacetum coccineum]